VFEDRILNVLPFAVLLLPLGGFIVLALFGDWDQEGQGGAGRLLARLRHGDRRLPAAAFTNRPALRPSSPPEGCASRSRYLRPSSGSTRAASAVPISLLIDPLSAGDDAGRQRHQPR